MTLLEVRTKLIELSGRYDLVIDAPLDYTDNGANYFIQAGQRYLDSLAEFSKEKATVEVSISSGQYQKEIGNFRAVESVWVRKSDGAMYQLDKLSLDELRGLYGVEVGGFASVAPSALAYYATQILRTSPPTATSDVNKAVIVMPPSDGSYTLLLEGLVFSETLDSDLDISYWTSVYPEVLIMAAQRQMEIHHRNTQGVMDFTFAITEAMRGIVSDLVAEDGGEVNVMDPSW